MLLDEEVDVEVGYWERIEVERLLEVRVVEVGELVVEQVEGMRLSAGSRMVDDSMDVREVVVFYIVVEVGR